MKRIIDAHLDLAWNALSWGRDQTLALEELNRIDRALDDHWARGRATTSLPELRRGNVAVCQATLLCRARRGVRRADQHSRLCLDYPSQAIAHAVAQGQLAYYRLLERQGFLRLIRTAEDLDSHWRTWRDDSTVEQPIGLILAMEGADPIVEPEQAQDWWEAGLRSVNLAHYGESHYAMGTGGDGPLTPDGRRLLGEFERLGMILDVTHLSDTSFFEALDAFAGPVLASHNNCRALVPGGRQFSDEQLARLFERGAVIGTALDAWMLAPGWVIGRTDREEIGVSLDAVADQIDHVCQRAGTVRHAALGSDLDGGFGSEQTPRDLDTIADLQKLAGILANRGYPDDAIDAIFHGNWLRFFRRNLPLK